jgi:acetyltransferase
MIGRTRVSRLLAGYRDRPRANLDAVASALLALSDLVLDFPEIAEMDVNPLLADGDGVIALDARIILHSPGATPVDPAICPYPEALSSRLERDGRVFQVRAIRPGDARSLTAMVDKTSVEDLRFRFHGARQSLTDAMAARLSQIDYDREMALVVDTEDGSIGGVVRLIFDPNYERAECALLVRSDLHHFTIGRTLLAMALDYARTRGSRLVWGDILTENAGALALARRAGAKMTPNAEEHRLTRVEFDLGARSSPPTPA